MEIIFYKTYQIRNDVIPEEFYSVVHKGGAEVGVVDHLGVLVAGGVRPPAQGDQHLGGGVAGPNHLLHTVKISLKKKYIMIFITSSLT